MSLFEDLVQDFMHDTYLNPLRQRQIATKWSGNRKGNGGTLTFLPALDARETKDSFVIEADLPGIRPENISVNVLENQITISGNTCEELETEDGRWHLQERRTGSFSRVVPLPTTADMNKITASCTDGVLVCTIGKKADTKSKMLKIPVTCTSGTETKVKEVKTLEKIQK